MDAIEIELTNTTPATEGWYILRAGQSRQRLAFVMQQPLGQLVVSLGGDLYTMSDFKDALWSRPLSITTKENPSP